MPFDTPYIIGIIRNLERGSLQRDEYTRLIEAPTAEDALHVLVETPYGRWMNMADGPSAAAVAIEERLVDTWQWLNEMIEDETVLHFMAARYDGLNIVSALLDWQAGQVEPQRLSRLGSITHGTLHSAIWHDMGWDLIPEHWETFIRQQREAAPQQAEGVSAWKTQLLIQSGQQVVTVLKLLAGSPLMRWYADWYERTVITRPEELDGQTEFAGAEHERAVDDELVLRLREERSASVGVDPIVAWWLALGIEARTLRILLMSKVQGASVKTLEAFTRRLYLSYE